jgi:hypothetical protein
MADHLVLVAQGPQVDVDRTLVRVNAGFLGDHTLDDWMDNLLLEIGQHVKPPHRRAGTRRGYVACSSPACRDRARLASDGVVHAGFLETATGLPLCPAMT